MDGSPETSLVTGIGVVLAILLVLWLARKFGRAVLWLWLAAVVLGAAAIALLRGGI
ncbi:MAG: hypothetical protein QGG17_04470 [Rhodospirillales bacterium]|nr:hypothetical protein [Rhodospirillales bacterium]MDP6804298.1 hypothetical protein [Rhodospirillales bacterium]